jgi:hypothetical protein
LIVAARLILTALYPLLLIARLAMALRGRDPLRSEEPAGSCWIERMRTPPARTYFSEHDSTVTSIAGAALQAVARAFAPSGEAARSRRATPVPDEIPDEVYTLW